MFLTPVGDQLTTQSHTNLSILMDTPFNRYRGKDSEFPSAGHTLSVVTT